MSWWDTKNLANFASQALKTAQKRIDKVLDIKEDETDPGNASLALSSGAEQSSEISTAPSIQGDSFFDSWLGDDVWSSGASSLAPTQTTPVSPSEGVSTSDQIEWKPKLLSGRNRQKTPELKSKSESVRATLINKADVGRVEAKEIGVEDETRKEKEAIEELDVSHESSDSRSSQLGFSTSFKSAFEQVRQSKPATEGGDVEPPKDLCQTQTEPDSGLLMGFVREEEKLVSTEKKLSSEPVRHVEVSRSLHYQLDSEDTSVMPEACLDDRAVLTSGRTVPTSSGTVSTSSGTVPTSSGTVPTSSGTVPTSSGTVPTSSSTGSTVEHILDDDAQESTSASGELQHDPAPQMEEDAGWDDVNLNLLAQDSATNLNDIELATDKKVPALAEVVTESSDDSATTVLAAPESSAAADIVDDKLKQDINWADVSMISGDTAHGAEPDKEAKQNVFDSSKGELLSSGLRDVTASVTSNTSGGDFADKKDALKSVSSSMLSSSSETDVGLKDVMSLEGSLAASDELSEGNKTLTADDLDTTRDDTDIDEIKQGEELERSQSVAVESADAPEFVTFKMGVEDEPEENDGEKQETEDFSTTESPTSCDAAASKVSDDLTELTVNTETSDKSEQTKKDDDSPRSEMSGSSYVRNLLEEAMAESSRGSSNTDNSHGSEAVRESEYTSGHTSADEIDTTTSSDIEIISHISTPNSNFRPLIIDTKPYDVSPSKAHAWSRSMRSVSPHGHKRSDSGSSAQSLQSRNGEELVSPEGGLHRATGDDHPLMDDRTWRTLDHRSHCRRNPGVDVNKRPMSGTSDQDASNNPYETEKLLKKLADMAVVLDAREKKQLELSQENIDLMETNNILKNQLKQLEEAREAELEDEKQMSEEFTKRISDSEKKLQMVQREKEILKKAVQDLEMGKRSENVMTDKLLKEKEQVIAELMEEGEKLSKQQLQSNNIIKKLRSKEKDNETTLRTQKQRVDEQKEEIERLEGILEVKVDTEKKHVDTINQLNMAFKSQEDEVNRLKSELEDAVEKARSLKVTLDNSYKEISELHRARATDVTEAHKYALNTEMQVKEQLKQRLEEHQHQSKQHQSALITQIEDLQLSLCRMEKEHGRREDILRQEISDLQQRLQEAEERNQELTQGVSAATRPLLRQIENLQTTYSVQSSSYERVEKNLTDRLSDAQSQLAMAVEKERLASDRLMEATARLTSLESQVSTLRQERVQLQTQLDMERAKVELMQESKNNDSMQRDTAIHKLQLELNELKKDKVLLENQLEMERMRVDAEKKKVTLVHEQLREKEITILQLSSSSNISSKHDAMMDSMSNSSSTPTLNNSMSGQDDLDRSSLLTTPTNRLSIYESLRLSSTSSLLENLQSQLKQREGEIAQLQSEICELERTRESMARQMVTLTMANEDMEQRLAEMNEIQTKYTELDGRYNALLQMYGEKVEEGQELRMDLQDIKEMYKTQIDELLKTKTIPSGWSYP